MVEGDLLDGEALRAAVKGVTRVYHLAGWVSRRREDAGALFRLHVDGTRALLEAALAAKVERVVVSSSSGTIGVSTNPDFMATEESEYPIPILKKWPYYLSKVFQEQTALAFGREKGLEVVCVNPSLLLGPGDSRLSSTDDVLRFLRRQIPAIPEGGLSFVDARDAAAATIAAMAKGRAGERYLLGAANWSFEKFLRKLEQVSHVPAPRLRVPKRLADFALGLLDAVSRVTGKEWVDPVSAEMSRHYWYIDSSKAARELGFAPRDPDVTLVDTVKYLKKKFLEENVDGREVSPRADSES